METQPESDQTQGQPAGESGSQGPKASSGQELMDELNRLGNKFVEVVDAAWNSDQRRRVEDDLRKGLESLATSLEDGIKQVGESKQAREFMDSAEDVAESVTAKVRASKVASELADALASGLRALSESMDRLAKDMKAKDASSPAAPPSSSTAETPQDIPIDRA
jgi:hypothetical protein